MDKEIRTVSKSAKFRRYCRKIHSHLSYLFVGVILVYAISGLTMNHLKDFNPQYMISVSDYKAKGKYPRKQNFTKSDVLKLLEEVDEQDNYTKHYYPNKSTMKVFLKNGSSFSMNIETGEVKYEALKKRPFFSQLSFLHYNPSGWWTVFSDIFAVCLIIICVSGLFINKGRNGLKGVGGIELIAGIMIPILFLIFL
ncbi:MAG: PepSY-associated TM helix domain-containing protein [Dysgonomonas sp.]|nr:PepSY-associated TM helix domain-containing protein [Dysgonomonas sp.]